MARARVAANPRTTIDAILGRSRARTRAPSTTEANAGSRATAARCAMSARLSRRAGASHRDRMDARRRCAHRDRERRAANTRGPQQARYRRRLRKAPPPRPRIRSRISARRTASRPRARSVRRATCARGPQHSPGRAGASVSRQRLRSGPLRRRNGKKRTSRSSHEISRSLSGSILKREPTDFEFARAEIPRCSYVQACAFWMSSANVILKRGSIALPR